MIFSSSSHTCSCSRCRSYTFPNSDSTNANRTSLVCGKYELGKVLGKGGFGEVCQVKDPRGKYFAAKFELPSSRDSILGHEARILEELRKSRISEVPKTYFFGTHQGDKVLVMDLLGKSLNDRFKEQGRKLSIKSVLMIGIQATRGLEKIHSHGFVHRDIKPHNMLMGKSENRKSNVYITDFGLSKRFIEKDSGQHIPRSEGHKFEGTVVFASTQAHRGVRQSRRSDLESLLYTLVYLATGSLPWVEVSDKKAVGDMKKNMRASRLCDGLPEAVANYFRMVRNLSYDEKPDYSDLRRILRGAMQRRDLKDDGKFDWM